MNNKNKTLIMVVGILLVIVVGVSFAYFLVSVNINGEGASTDIGTSSLPLVQYDAGDFILVKDAFMPKDVITKSFKVIVTPTNVVKDVTYRIYLDIADNTFVKCTEDNYDEATNLCEKDANELVYRLKDSNGNVIKEGDLTGSSGQIEIAKETKTQEIRTEYEYTIEIEFVDTNKDQNHNTNKTFNGEIKVEFANNYLTIGDIIASVNPKDTTPDFSQVATLDEGVYKAEDGTYGGYSYYWRGATTNNYVKFGGFCWRIVRINGDKSMRLIYDGTTCHANGTGTEDNLLLTRQQPYHELNNQSNYVGWTYEGTTQRTLSGDSSSAKKQLESWYASNLINNDDRIVYGKYCNDRNADSGETWSINSSNIFHYAAFKRLYTNFTPTLNCSAEDIYTLKIGLITADEVMFAGGRTGPYNSSYYLYNLNSYWTMTPSLWSGSFAAIFSINTGGALDTYPVHLEFALRPVINLKSDTHFQTSGNGTLDNPYVVLN